MEYFSLDIWTIYGLVAFALLYLIAYGGRWIESYLQGTSPPTDRVTASLIVWMIVGAICGSMLQSQIDKTVRCHDAGQPLILCFAR